MTTRRGTFSTRSVLSSMGVKGGRLPELADTPLQPVVIAGDFSRTQAPEAFEARAYVGFDSPATLGFGWPVEAQWVGVYFWSLGRGGSILERVSSVVNVLGDGNGPLEAPASTGVLNGVWLVQRSTLTPDEWLQHSGGGNAAVFETPKLEIGGQASRSQVRIASYFTPWHQANDATVFNFWDPFGYNVNPKGWDVVLGRPARFDGSSGTIFEIGGDSRWFVPRATGLSFMLYSAADNPFGSGVTPEWNFEIQWREASESIGPS